MKTSSVIFPTSYITDARANAAAAGGYSWAQGIRTSISGDVGSWVNKSLNDVWISIPDPTFPPCAWPHPGVQDDHLGTGTLDDAMEAAGAIVPDPSDSSKYYQRKQAWGASYFPDNGPAARAWISGVRQNDNKEIFRHTTAGFPYAGSYPDDGWGYKPATDRWFYIGSWAMAQYARLLRNGGGYDKLDTGEMGEILKLAWAYALTGNVAYARVVGVQLARLAYFCNDLKIDDWLGAGEVGVDGQYAASIGYQMDVSLGQTFNNAGNIGGRPNGDSTYGLRLGTLYDAEWPSQLCQAYELVYDGLDDTTLLTFLDNKAVTFTGLQLMKHPNSGGYDVWNLRRLIENKLLVGLLNHSIERRWQGNAGRMLVGIGNLGLALDDYNYEQLLINTDSKLGGNGFQNSAFLWGANTSQTMTLGWPSPLGKGEYADALRVIQGGAAPAAMSQTLVTGLGTNYPRTDDIGNSITLQSGAIYYFGGWIKGCNAAGTDTTRVNSFTGAAPTAVSVSLYDTSAGSIIETPVTMTGSNWTYFKVGLKWTHNYPGDSAGMIARVANTAVGGAGGTSNQTYGYYLWRPRVWQSGVGLDSPNAHYSNVVVSTGITSEIPTPLTNHWVKDYLYTEGAPISWLSEGEPIGPGLPHQLDDLFAAGGELTEQGSYQDKDLYMLINMYRPFNHSALVGNTAYDPFEHAKFKEASYNVGMYRLPLPYPHNNWRLHIGDESRAGKLITGDASQDIFVNAEWYADLYGDLGDYRYAQLAYAFNGDSTTGLHYNIGKTHADANDAAADIAAVVAGADGPRTFPKLEIFPSSMGFLRNQDKTACVYLWWGSMVGTNRIHDNGDGSRYNRTGERWGAHGHRDNLQFGVFASGFDLAPDIGYSIDGNFGSDHYSWSANTLSHNCVVVGTGITTSLTSGWVNFPNDTTAYMFGQADSSEKYVTGKLEAAFDSTNVRYVEASNNQAYENMGTYDPARSYITNGTVTEYRRAMAMVDINTKEFYFIDFFKVKGGNHHLYSFHGPITRLTADDGTACNIGQAGLSASSKTGTLAGTSYAWANDPWDYTGWKTGGSAEDHFGGYGAKDPGMSHITSVSKYHTAFSGNGTLRYYQWNAKDYHVQVDDTKYKAAIRLFPASIYNGFSIGTGKFTGTPSNLDYWFGHRAGAAPLVTNFVNVYDVCSSGSSNTVVGNPHVSGVQQLTLISPLDTNGTEAVALKVIRYDNTIDYIGWSTNVDKTFEVTGGLKWKGRFAIVNISGSIVKWSSLHGGNVLEYNGTVIQSTGTRYTIGNVAEFTTGNIYADERYIGTTTVLEQALVGSYIRVISTTQNYQNSCYKISRIEHVGSIYRAWVKDVTFMVDYINKFDYTAGIRYAFGIGDDFEIMGSNESSVINLVLPTTTGTDTTFTEVGNTMLGTLGYLPSDSARVTDSVFISGYTKFFTDGTATSDESRGALGFTLNEGVTPSDSFTGNRGIWLHDEVKPIESFRYDSAELGNKLISGFVAKTALEQPGIRLSYYTPNDNKWYSTLTVRKTKTYPVTYTDGVVVHTGLFSVLGAASGISFEDRFDMRQKTTYYYTVFAHARDERTAYMSNSNFAVSGTGGFASWTEQAGNFTITRGSGILTPVPRGSNLKVTVTGPVASGTTFVTQTFSGLSTEIECRVDLSYRNTCQKVMGYQISIGANYWSDVSKSWVGTATTNPLPLSDRFLLSKRYTSQFISHTSSGVYTFDIRAMEGHVSSDIQYLFQSQIFSGGTLEDGNNYCVVTTGTVPTVVDAGIDNSTRYMYDPYKTVAKALSGGTGRRH